MVASVARFFRWLLAHDIKIRFGSAETLKRFHGNVHHRQHVKVLTDPFAEPSVRFGEEIRFWQDTSYMMVLVVSAIFASAFMMVTVYLHLYRLHPHVHRNYNRGCAMSTGLAGFIAPDFDKTVEQEHLREKFPRKLPD